MYYQTTVMYIACFIYSLPLSIMIYMFKHSLSVEDVFVKVASKLSLTDFVVMLIIVIRNALIEEVFFRNYLMNMLLQYTSSGKANLIQAVIFSALHFDNIDKRSINVLIDRKYHFIHWFMSGIIYGWMKQLSASLIVPTIFHSLHNVRVYLLPIITA